MKESLTAQAQREATTLIRTAIVAEFNTARLAEFAASGVTAIEWVSVIDDATTDICLGLDGLQWTLPEDPEDYEAYIGIGHDVPFPGPVAHWNCRSTQIPIDSSGSDFFDPSEQQPQLKVNL